MAARGDNSRAGIKRGTGTAARGATPAGADAPTVVSPRSRAKAGSGAKGSPGRPESRGHRQEVIALVLLGVAVFLVVVIVADEVGGVLGRGAGAALGFVFGRLALLAPLALLAVAVSLVVGKKIWRSAWFVGGLVFLFGLLLLVAAGAPPFAGHGPEYFFRAEFEPRAGALGEALYALFHSFSGTLGVGIIGWVAVVAGLLLATGMTLRRMAAGTRKAAGSVRQSAGQYRERSGGKAPVTGGETPSGWAIAQTASGRVGGRVGDDAFSEGFGPRVGPVDLVGDAQDFPVTLVGTDAVRSPFGDEFDDWSDGRPPSKSPLAPGQDPASTTGGVLDGARAYSDIYGPSKSSSGTEQGRAAAVTGATPPVGAPTAQATTPASAAAAAGAGAAVGEGLATGGPEVHQETLPGLARPPRQIELAVEEPAYVMPEAELLKKSSPPPLGRGIAEKDTAAVVLQALAQFGVEARVIGMVVGPRVTRYELQLAPGTKVSKVAALKDDLAYALATTEIRILTPIPGMSAVGVEVPNQRPDFVTLGDIYREFPKTAGPLMVWLGKDISGKAVWTDLTKLPHLLIAGTTGSGKSGCVNCIVSSILLRATPEQVRLIMVDPKKVELSHYDRIPHLLVPVVTNMKDAAGVLHNVAKEMEDRYELMELEHARSLADMNKARARRGERPLPYIVIVIDELADLMMVSPQEVEDYVIRLAQKSRAVGIHLVVATQRPSADVITGMIKANIPSRIAFAVSSQTDSRVILDVNGAETLLGRGDMLFKPLGSSHLQRVQGAYITEEEIAHLVNHWRHQAEPEFREELLRRPPDPKEVKKGDDDFDPDSDDLLADAAQLVIETGSASVSMLQRRLRVGYTRAGRLIDMLERRGIVGPWEGSKPRQILVEADEFEHVLAALRAEERGHVVEDGTYGD